MSVLSISLWLLGTATLTVIAGIFTTISYTFYRVMKVQGWDEWHSFDEVGKLLISISTLVFSLTVSITGCAWLLLLQVVLGT